MLSDLVTFGSSLFPMVLTFPHLTTIVSFCKKTKLLCEKARDIGAETSFYLPLFVQEDRESTKSILMYNSTLETHAPKKKDSVLIFIAFAVHI